MHPKLVIAAVCAATLAPWSALAERPPAADPAAQAPPPKYESAFSGYRAYQDQPVRNWAEVNEEVAKAGGHIGIMGGTGGHGAQKVPAQAPLGQGQPPVRGAPDTPAAKPHH